MKQRAVMHFKRNLQKEVILAQLLHDWLSYLSKNVWDALEMPVWDMPVELADKTQDLQETRGFLD